jgi:hypothetical protein
MAIDYTVARALHTNTTTLITKFLYEHILTRFGCPLIIVTNQGTHLSTMHSNILLTILSLDISVLPCIIYKDMNRLKVQIRFLETSVIKLVNENKNDWDEHLSTVFFSYQTTYKVGTCHTLLQLVYGLHIRYCLQNTYYYPMVNM